MSDERREDSVRPTADVLERDVGNVEACLSKNVSNVSRRVAGSRPWLWLLTGCLKHSSSSSCP